MTQIINVKFNNSITQLKAESGMFLADILLSADFALPFDCSGKGLCGKCKVYAPDCKVSDADRRLLSQKQIDDGIRLACAVKVEDDITVELFNEGEYIKAKQMKDNAVEKGVSYSFAVDIGTTTVAVYLVNENGVVCRTASRKNAQARYGADVISRIAFCKDEKSVEIMQNTIAFQLNSMMCEILENARLDEKDMDKVVFVGNTTMLHLLMGKSPLSMGISPYKPEFLEKIECTLGDISKCFEVMKSSRAFVLPSVSAFVGADIVSAVLAVDLKSKNENALLIDLGTNAEIVLFYNGKMLSASASAGPAFEGANIRCGMCAGEGAIRNIEIINGKIECEIIGDCNAKGICGSGLINAVSVFLKTGILSSNGKISEDEEFSDFVFEKDGVFGVWLTDEVVITAEDIHNILLAKSAVSVAIKLLLKYANAEMESIDKLYIAGAFGASLDINNATTVGIIPKTLKFKTQAVGNAAGMGAVKSISNEKLLDISQQIAVECESINLSADKDFEELFLNELKF